MSSNMFSLSLQGFFPQPFRDAIVVKVGELGSDNKTVFTTFPSSTILFPMDAVVELILENINQNTTETICVPLEPICDADLTSLRVKIALQESAFTATDGDNIVAEFFRLVEFARNYPHHPRLELSIKEMDRRNSEQASLSGSILLAKRIEIQRPSTPDSGSQQRRSWFAAPSPGSQSSGSSAASFVNMTSRESETILTSDVIAHAPPHQSETITAHISRDAHGRVSYTYPTRATTRSTYMMDGGVTDSAGALTGFSPEGKLSEKKAGCSDGYRTRATNGALIGNYIWGRDSHNGTGVAKKKDRHEQLSNATRSTMARWSASTEFSSDDRPSGSSYVLHFDVPFDADATRASGSQKHVMSELTAEAATYNAYKVVETLLKRAAQQVCRTSLAAWRHLAYSQRAQRWIGRQYAFNARRWAFDLWRSVRALSASKVIEEASGRAPDVHGTHPSVAHSLQLQFEHHMSLLLQQSQTAQADVAMLVQKFSAALHADMVELREHMNRLSTQHEPSTQSFYDQPVKQPVRQQESVQECYNHSVERPVQQKDSTQDFYSHSVEHPVEQRESTQEFYKQPVRQQVQQRQSAQDFYCQPVEHPVERPGSRQLVYRQQSGEQPLKEQKQLELEQGRGGLEQNQLESQLPTHQRYEQFVGLPTASYASSSSESDHMDDLVERPKQSVLEAFDGPPPPSPASSDIAQKLKRRSISALATVVDMRLRAISVAESSVEDAREEDLALAEDEGGGSGKLRQVSGSSNELDHETGALGELDQETRSFDAVDQEGGSSGSQDLDGTYGDARYVMNAFGGRLAYGGTVGTQQHEQKQEHEERHLDEEQQQEYQQYEQLLEQQQAYQQQYQLYLRHLYQQELHLKRQEELHYRQELDRPLFAEHRGGDDDSSSYSTGGDGGRIRSGEKDDVARRSTEQHIMWDGVLLHQERQQPFKVDDEGSRAGLATAARNIMVENLRRDEPPEQQIPSEVAELAH